MITNSNLDSYKGLIYLIKCVTINDDSYRERYDDLVFEYGPDAPS